MTSHDTNLPVLPNTPDKSWVAESALGNKFLPCFPVEPYLGLLLCGTAFLMRNVKHQFHKEICWYLQYSSSDTGFCKILLVNSHQELWTC